MPILLRAEIWDQLECAGGSRLAVFGALTRCEQSDALDGNSSVVIEFAADDGAAAFVATRRILRLVFDAGGDSEWRIQKPERLFGSEGATRRVTAVSILFDLADATVIRETSPTGVVRFDVGLFQVTLSEVIDTYVLAQLPSAYAYFARGTVDPTGLYDVTWNKATPLALLQQLAQAAVDGTTRLPAELRVRRNGSTGYFIDILTEIGASDPVPDLRSRKNIQTHQLVEDAAEQATVIVAFGGDDGSGASSTLARCAWRLDNGAATVFEITDPEGGPSPMLEDDQLNGMWVAPVGGGPLVQILDSAAGSPATVTLASSTGITDGDVVELRADGGGTLVTELSAPAAAAAPPTGYGRKVGTLERPDVVGLHNWAPNPFLRTWTGTDPDDWTIGTSGSSKAQNTDPLYTQYGGNSLRLSCGGGPASATAVSSAFYPRPVAGASQFSVGLRLFVAGLQGDAKILFSIFGGSVNTILGGASRTWVATDYPFPGIEPRLATGNFVLLGIEGCDLTQAASIGAKLRVELQAGLDAGGGPGSFDVYLDAFLCVAAPVLPAQWMEYSSANALWHAANRVLALNQDPIASYEIGALDRTRLDGSTYPFEAITLGGTIRDTVPEQGIDGALVRVMAKMTNWLVPGETTLEVATRRKLLADALRQAQGGSGATITVAGSGGGAATPPTGGSGGGTSGSGGGSGSGGSGTSGGGTGGTPGSTGGGSGGAAGALPLLKTLWADTPGMHVALEEFPSAAADTGDEDHVLLDLSSTAQAYLSGAVQAELASADLALQYLRPSDSAWRYLDGTAGPALPLDAAGDIIGAAVDLELDARGVRWCRVIAEGGDDASTARIGHLAVHGGGQIVVPTGPPAVITDVTDLITLLGGDSLVPFFYDARTNVTLNGTDAEAIDDVRGAGFGGAPTLTSGTSTDWPAYDAVNGVLQFRGSGSGRDCLTGFFTGLDTTQGFTLIFIGTVRETGDATSRRYVAGIADAARLTGHAPTDFTGVTYAMGVRTSSPGSLIAGESLAGGAFRTIESTVTPDTSAVRLCAITSDGAPVTSNTTFVVPDDARRNLDAAGTLNHSDFAVTLGGFSAGDWDIIFGGNRAACDVYALIGVYGYLQLTQIEAVTQWAELERDLTRA